MQSSTLEVIAALVAALEQGQRCFLATVISTWGSSPRPPGAMMVWSDASGVVGSVSGGCVEEDLLTRIRAGEFSATSLLSYGDNPEREGHIALPCGGVLRVLLESPGVNRLDDWRQLLAHLQQRQGACRQVNISSGVWQWQVSAPFPVNVEDGLFRSYCGPVRKLLIVGANQISWYLADFAASLDFDVTICDPGEDLGEQWQRADFQFLRCYPDGIVQRQFGDASSAVVAVSHDPRLDDMALLEALPSEAFYVGAMGSLLTSANRRERLRSLDVPEQQLARLHAPVGLDIGSKTPAEIAISIAAQLVQAYTGMPQP